MSAPVSLGGTFENLVEPCLERIPILEVTQRERRDGRDYVIARTNQRNVLTELDRGLSRHLAPPRGIGFPAFTVSVEVAERDGSAAPGPLARAHHARPHPGQVTSARLVSPEFALQTRRKAVRRRIG